MKEILEKMKSYENVYLMLPERIYIRISKAEVIRIANEMQKQGLPDDTFMYVKDAQFSIYIQHRFHLETDQTHN